MLTKTRVGYKWSNFERRVYPFPATATATMDPPQQYADLWFSDGSVVLKTDSYLFRVHKTILARESMVFNDMFAFPVNGPGDDPEEREDKDKVAEYEEYEGFPIVPLIEDDEIAVIHLLKMIYKPK